ncbi:LOW QUALITY PROTEIN: transmembrane protein 80-like [Scomber scombrus]|uniref:LOW QUALITY PROTEIN: transmembrane protein 80-like n=1 Tax=Scomber scombrus TaxID=13677 RepID=UPI002DDC0156|nr:LOW QUALITY PROTEIN: transmembrane protein 80-like [Scomber scombrus]
MAMPGSEEQHRRLFFVYVCVCVDDSTLTLHQLPSVTLQVLLKLTTVYFVFYFLFTLSLIIRKSLVLSYPVEALASDVSALFLLAALEFLHFFCGVKGNLTESESYLLINLIVTVTTIVLTVYFLVWQTYVMWVDVVISSVLLVVYGLNGILAFSTFARITSVYS